MAGVMLVASMVTQAAAHASLSMPAMRAGVESAYCPWCQGTQEACDPTPSVPCIPEKPCWTTPSGGTVSPNKYGQDFSSLMAPDGTPWVDPNGGPSQPPAVWCPGQSYPIRYYVNADHNGVFRWESQRSSPGAETEANFRNFSDWYSFGGNPEAKYYNHGTELLAPGICGNGGDEWSNDMGHCQDDVWVETRVSIPSNMEVGETVVRWMWYGCMDTQMNRHHRCELSMFVNCLDVVIGTAEQCGASPPAPPAPPAPPSGCPGGSLDACIDLCAPSEFRTCVMDCEQRCSSMVI